MKTKGLILILVVLLFSSCIVKSLYPFYTKDSLNFNEKLLGSWTDNKKGEWTIASIKDEFIKDRKEGIEFSEDDKKAFQNYKDGYVINYIKKEKEAGFIAMPFKIDNHYFMDFIPLEIEDDEINSLAAQHLLKTHSVAKLEINSDHNISFSWLSEKRMKEIFEANKIRLKHEKVGPEEVLLLTASSEELYTFLKKYIKSDIKNKWGDEDKKINTSDRLNLTKSDATP